VISVGGKLESDIALKAQLDAALAGAALSKGNQDWYAALSAFIAEVIASIPGKLQDVDFLKRLWDSNTVSATGMGSVKIGPALEDAGFRDWFAGEVPKPLSADMAEAEAQLTAFYNDLQERLKALCGRTPRLGKSQLLP
jgi:5-methylcytosine-specific restriction protein B